MSSQDGAELTKLHNKLKKNMEDEEKLLDLLKIVKDAKVNRDLLKAIPIGKTIKTLSNDSRKAVANAAAPILDAWKAQAKAEKGGKGAVSTPKLDRSLSNTSTSSGLFEASEEGAQATTATEQAQLEKKTLEKVARPADAQRKKLCELLEALFSDDVEGYGQSAISNVCNHIEEAMASAFGANSSEYKSKYRTLKANLKMNPRLRLRLLYGDLPATELVQMPAEKLMSEEKQQQIKAANEENFQAYRQDWLDANRESIMKSVGINIEGGMYTCSRCGSKKTTHYQKQTRSADEPMTVFVQCTQCPNRWRC